MWRNVGGWGRVGFPSLQDASLRASPKRQVRSVDNFAEQARSEQVDAPLLLHTTTALFIPFSHPLSFLSFPYCPPVMSSDQVKPKKEKKSKKAAVVQAALDPAAAAPAESSSKKDKKRKAEAETEGETTTNGEAVDEESLKKEKKRLKKEKKAAASAASAAVSTDGTPAAEDVTEGSKKKKEKKDKKSEKSSAAATPAPAVTTPAAVSTGPLSEASQAYLAQHSITISHQYTPLLDFASLPISPKLAPALKDFKTPTPIQACSWPALFDGKDVVGVAETGSGKTLGFGVSIVLVEFIGRRYVS